MSESTGIRISAAIAAVLGVLAHGAVLGIAIYANTSVPVIVAASICILAYLYVFFPVLSHNSYAYVFALFLVGALIAAMAAAEGLLIYCLAEKPDFWKSFLVKWMDRTFMEDLSQNTMTYIWMGLVGALFLLDTIAFAIIYIAFRSESKGRTQKWTVGAPAFGVMPYSTLDLDGPPGQGRLVSVKL